MTRVTFILTQSLECPSGLGRYWPLAQGLAKRGYDVRVLALHPTYHELTQRRFIRDGVTIWYVGQMHVRKAGSEKHYFRPARLVWVAAVATLRLTWAAITTTSDRFHIGKPHPMNGIAALALLALRRRVYLDCDDLEATSNRFGAGWQRAVVSWFEDHLPRWVCGVTVNTTFLLTRLRPLVPEDRPIVLVPNAVSSTRFQMPDPGAVAQVRQQHRLEERPVVAYVGSMSLTNHAIDLLLESFAQVVTREIPEAALMLVGGGEDLALLQAMAIDWGIQENVRFVGRIPPDDVPAYYAAADVVVDPVYDNEVARARSPLKLYESLAVGTPVVTGDAGDRRRALDNNEAMLVPAGDANALGVRLVAILEDSGAREGLRRWAASRREELFWENRIDEFVRVYETT
jgi:glycosyltransferase involved in cell wall biosynthesis